MAVRGDFSQATYERQFNQSVAELLVSGVSLRRSPLPMSNLPSPTSQTKSDSLLRVLAKTVIKTRSINSQRGQFKKLTTGAASLRLGIGARVS